MFLKWVFSVVFQCLFDVSSVWGEFAGFVGVAKLKSVVLSFPPSPEHHHVGIQLLVLDLTFDR